eukprot:PhF_6_TR33515/c0_g1_i1/m.48854
MEGTTPTDLLWKHDVEYYNDLARKAQYCLGTVTTDPVKGKCLVATRNITCGECVLTEKALVWSQNMDEYNKARIPVCSMCLKSLEKPEDIALRVLGPELSQGMPQCSDTSFLCSRTPCRKGCGEHYCSAKCEETAWDQYHSVLCSTELSKASKKAWQRLHDANWTNAGVDYSDTVYVALKTVAMTLAKSRGTGGKATKSKPSLTTAYAPYDMLIKMPWERFTFLYLVNEKDGREEKSYKTYVANPAGNKYVQKAQRSDRTKEEFLDSLFSHFKDIFNFSQEEQEFFTTARLSLLLGMILLNGQERSPNSPYYEWIEAMKSQSSTKSLLQTFHRKLRSEKGRDIVTTLSTSTRGQAVYRIGSCFNHSCEPNVQVTYKDDNREDMWAVAMRDIVAGEELYISYIDESLPYWERQLHLFDHYLFRCVCTKCVAEDPDQAK